MKRVIAYVLVIAAVLVPRDAAAQGPQRLTPERLSELSLEQLLAVEITTASRALETSGSAPATVYVISKRDIRARGYSTLSDVLKDLPGMETVENYYSEQGTLVPVRGVAGNNKIVLLVNGMRVNPPGGEELMIRNDVSVRFAEQIEVIYGSGSTLYGQDAISAVINIKTIEPDARQLDAVGAFGNGSGGEAYTSFGMKIRERAETPVTLSGHMSVRQAGLSNFSREFPIWWQKYSDFLGPMGRSTDPVRKDFGYNGLLRIDSKHASLQAWFRESGRSSAEGSGEGGAEPVLWFVDEAYWRDRSLVVEGQQGFNLTDRLSLRSILTFNRYEIDPSSRYVFPAGPTDLFLRDFKYGVGNGISLEEEVDYQIDSSTRVTAGAAVTSYDIIPKVTVLDGADPRGDVVTQAGALTYYLRPNDPASAVHVNRAQNLHYRNLGFYAEGTRRIAKHFKAIAGVRLDSNSRFDDTPVSPRLALIYNDQSNRLSVKYIFTKAYVAPAPYFGHNVFDNGVQISSPNHELEPERATSNEVNVMWQDDRVLASASLYVNRHSNLLITAQSEIPETIVTSLVYVNPDGTGERLVRHSINLGSSHSVGVDLSARYNATHLSFWGSYSFVDVARDIGSITTGLDQISAHNVRAGATWRIGPSLSLTPSLVLRSTPMNLGRNYDIPGVSLNTPHELNLNALYSLSDAWDAFVTIRNLTDNHYALRGVAGPALQEPFTMSAGLRFRY